MNTPNTQTPAATVGRTPGPLLPVQLRDSHFDGFGIHHVTIVDGRGRALFTMPKEYAGQFVTACNSHAANMARIEELEGALANTLEHLRLTVAEHHRLLDVHGYSVKGHPLDNPVMARARAALAAKEGQP